jgi:hypothetical protein
MKTRTMWLATLLPACLFAIIAVAHAQTAAEAAPAPQATPQAPPPAEARPAVTSQAWMIEFERSAKSSGTITFRVWPYAGDPIDIAVDVKQGDTENAIALKFKDAFRKGLGVQDYRTDAQRAFVRLVAVHGERRFALELVGSNVDGVRIDLGRE